MDDKNEQTVPALPLKVRDELTEKDFKSAIRKLTRSAQSMPVPRLYDAYLWLKERLDDENEEFNRQYAHFIERLLRILEERGAAGSEIYSEILKDSVEYKYLKGLFHSSEQDYETAVPYAAPKRSRVKKSRIKKISLKTILQKKDSSLTEIGPVEWNRMVNDYFEGINTDESFETNCVALVKKINKKAKKEPYHVETVIGYAFNRILKKKGLSLKDKNFAMRLLNSTIDQGETWKRMHPGYLEIIRR